MKNYQSSNKNYQNYRLFKKLSNRQPSKNDKIIDFSKSDKINTYFSQTYKKQSSVFNQVLKIIYRINQAFIRAIVFYSLLNFYQTNYYKLPNQEQQTIEPFNKILPTNSMEKDLSFKSIKNQKLQNLVLQWIQTYNHLQRHPLYRYKFGLQKILPLPQKLLVNAILYTFYTTFPFIIEDLTTKLKIQTNFELKKIYSDQFYTGQWKKEFIFEFTMIYLTKTTSHFISQHFSNLEINQNLESQIFIILYKVFIGTEVGTKLFHVTAKKYLKILNIKTSKNSQIKPSISLNLQGKDSIFTLGGMKQSSKYISEVMHSQIYGGTRNQIMEGSSSLNKNGQKYSNQLNVRRNPNRSKISFLRTKIYPTQQKSNLDVFYEQLKSNLHVDPLPVIEQKKYDIYDYEEMKLRNTLRSHQNQIIKQQKQDQNKHKKYQINSSKITQSMETVLSSKMQQQNLNLNATPANNNQGPKLNLTRQLNLKHFSYFSQSRKKHSLCDKSLDNKKNQKQKLTNFNNISIILPSKNHGKSSLQSWKKLLKQMKQDSKASQKQNIARRIIEGKQSQGHSLYEAASKVQKLPHQEIKTCFQESKTQSNHLSSKVKTQSNQKVYGHHKSQSTSNLKDSYENRFTKLDTFTATNEKAFKILSNNLSNDNPDNQIKNKKKNNFDHQNLQKLSKTSKLKLGKLQFLSECKKREQKLQSHKNHNQFKGGLIQ